MKKFCLVIAVILVFVVSCDNLYNDVAEEKKDMQKLIFVNADGVSVDLTKDPYGITEWEGFSKVDLNLQTQQVPFHDGSVYLDGLLSERELSVTLAMNDEKNLEKRYRLRCELIEILNPKLGEGTLIYTNNYTSKQIKVIPQTPLFENHNSNDSGTPKASLAWTACDPYWEDLEETKVSLLSGLRQTIINDGDVDCGVNISLLSTNVNNPQIENITTHKKIELNGTFQTGININTHFGKKTINEEDLIFNLGTFAFNLNDITFSESLGIFVCIGEKGSIITSSDGINWTLRTSNLHTSLTRVIFSESLDLFIIIGEYGLILTSPDGINWTQRTSGTSKTLIDIACSESLSLFCVTGADGTILTSPDGINWTQRASDLTQFLDIIYSESIGLFVALGRSIISYISSDGINWTEISISTEDDSKRFIICSENLGKFYLFNNFSCYESSDGVAWFKTTGRAVQNPNSVCYSKNKGMFVAVKNDGGTFISYDTRDWNKTNTSNFSSIGLGFKALAYSESLSLFVGCTVYNGSFVFISSDGINWSERIQNLNFQIEDMIFSERLKLFIGVGSEGKIFTSPDGINWTQRTSGTDEYLRGVVDSENLNLTVCIGYNNTILTSPDGINWTEQSLSGEHDFYSIGYSEKLRLFVVGGYIESPSSWVTMTSPDGINWTERLNTDSLNFTSFCYSERLNMFVATVYDEYGLIPSIYISYDGISWTKTFSLTIDLHLNDITFSESLGIFVCVGGTISDYLIILTSPDGINWIENRYLTSLVGLNKVVFSKKLGIFVTGGGDGISFYSNFLEKENLIGYLTSDSDMSFSLQKGKNELLLNKNLGDLNALLTYRQKYLGV